MKINKNLILILFGRIAQMAIIFITYRMLTSFLSKSAVGEFFYFQSIIMFFGLALVNPAGVYLQRKIHDWQRDNQIFSALAKFNYFLITVAFLCICVVFLLYLSTSFYSALGVAFALGLYIWAQSLSVTLASIINILGYRLQFVVTSFGMQAAALVFALVCVKVFVTDAKNWVLGLGLGFSLFSIICFSVLRTKQQMKQAVPVTLNTKELVNFCAPIALINFLAWALMHGYRPLVMQLSNLEALSYIALGLSLSHAIAVAFEYLVQQYFFPDLYKTMGDKNLRAVQWRQYFYLTSSFYYFICCGILFGSAYLITILADVKFFPAWKYVGVGVLAEYLRLTINTLSLATQSEMKTKLALLPYFCGAVVSAVFTLFILYFNYDFSFIAAGIVLGYLVVSVMLIGRVKEIMEFQLVLKKIIIHALLIFPLILYTYVFKSNFLIPPSLYLGVIHLFFIFAYCFGAFIILNREVSRKILYG